METRPSTKFASGRYLLVLSDLKLPGDSGLDVLREARRADPTLPVILVTAYGSVEEAVTAMKEGAFDFIQKPVDLDHLKLLMDRAARQQELLRENLLLREEYAARYGFPRIVGEHSSMKEASQMTQRVAATDSTVLLLGRKRHRQGTFRARRSTISARAPICRLSRSIAPPFPKAWSKTNCSATSAAPIPAPARARSAKSSSRIAARCFSMKLASCRSRCKASCCGCWKSANSIALAARRKSKSTCESSPPPTRICAPLSPTKPFARTFTSVSAAVPITIPPLRDRGDDVLLLAEHFLDRFKREFRKPDLALTDEARSRLRSYSWPGNVRELQNAIERAAILSNGSDIDAAALRLPEARPAAEELPGGMLEEEFLWEGPLEEVSQRAVTHVERFKIQNALRESKWNKTRAAEKLGVSYKTLLSKIRSLGLEN